MNVLAIETATTACAIGLATSSGERLSLVVNDDRHHTESLVPGIRELLASVGLAARSLDRIVVDRGPGLYTGLRVGLATAVGLALLASGCGSGSPRHTGTAQENLRDVAFREVNGINPNRRWARVKNRR